MERQRPPLPSLDRQREIVVAARSGDERAHATLAEWCRPDLEAHAARRMGARLARFSTPEDVAQEALVRAVRALSSLDESAVFSDFRAIAKQHANWVLRDRGQQAQRFVAESVIHPPAMDAPPDRAASQRSRGPVTHADEVRWLRERLSSLDPKYGRVLELFLDGSTLPQIAAELDIGEDAARKRHSRALELLRSRMASES